MLFLENKLLDYAPQAAHRLWGLTHRNSKSYTFLMVNNGV